MEHISSRQNPLVKRIRELARRRATGGDVLLDGPHLVEEALRSSLHLTTIVVVSDEVEGPFAAIIRAAVDREVRIATMPRALFESIAPTRQASGILALALARDAALEDLASAEPLILVLDSVQDPGNVGAIIRAAEACGATGVLIGPGSADPWGWKALRGAMGSTFRLPVLTTESLRDAIDVLRARGVRIIATAPRDGTPLAAAQLDRGAAVLLGGEGPGLPPDLVALADERITIEMRPPVESLNVAISAALIAYEASRQRSHVAVR